MLTIILEYVLKDLLPFFIIGFVALWTAKSLLNWRVSDTYDGPAVVAAGNTAVAMRRACYMVGIGIAMTGVLAGDTGASLGEEIGLSIVYGLLAIGFQLAALYINDSFILPGIDNNQALKDRNLAVGLVEGGAMIGTGFVLAASMKGDGGVVSLLVFFILAHVAMLLMLRFYEWIRSDLKVVEAVKQGNLAAAVLLGGKLLAYGLLMQAAVSGDATDWGYDLSLFAVSAVMGFVFLFSSEWAIDKWLVPQMDIPTMIRGDHVAPTMVVPGGKVAMAAIISVLVI